MSVKLKGRFLELRKKILEKLFHKMNEKQMEAIFEINGPLMILAGAGSGKTTVIVNRILNMIKYGKAYCSDEVLCTLEPETIEKLELAVEENNFSSEILDLISAKRVAPWNILAITFTNKAAKEMKERLLSLTLDGSANDVWASTFHSTCAKILRMYAEKLGYSNHFTIYDSDDVKKLIKDCQKKLKVDDKILPLKSVIYEISSAKDKLIDQFKYFDLFGDKQNQRLSYTAQIYKMYQKHLIESDAMDFDDLIFNTVRLFEKFPDILEKYQDKFQYILVDEYQDTNFAQNRFVNLLAKKHGNLCVVGDDDQSIYKFRGATVKNILEFEKDHPGAKIVRLEQNYRSTKNILDAANSIISNNKLRKGKTLWTNNPCGEKLSLHTAYSEYDEAKYILDVVKEKVSSGLRYSDFAVLYRANSQSNVIEKVFAKAAVPYRMLGGVRFYERQEIKDMIAYLSVINNPSDEIRLRRIINQPRRSIGERTIVQALEIAASENLDLMHVIRNASNYEQFQRVSCKLEAFSNLIDEMIYEYKSGEISLHGLYQMILDRTQYIEFLKNDKDDCQARLENIQELMNNIMQYEEEKGSMATLSGFLEEVALLTDIDNYDENADCVVMMTMHSAKGLEFPVVFLPGFEEGIFPGAQCLEDESEIEEERRLAYVGITRAKGKLYILNSDSRMVFGSTSHNKQSRFIQEIPEDLIEKTKSRDWKKMDPSEDRPQSAQEIRLKSAIAARNFGQIVGGVKIRENDHIFSIGDVVTHVKFGEGEVMSSNVGGDSGLVQIKFKKIEETKTLMASFVKLKED